MEKVSAWPLVLTVATTAALGGGLIYYANKAPPWLERQLEPPATEMPEVATTAEAIVALPATTVAELRARCVAEVRANAPRPLGAESACREYERVSHFDTVTVIASDPVAPRRDHPALQPAIRAEQERVASVYVNDCRRLGYGSIEYRRCRANEAERLRGECSRFSGLIESSAGNATERDLWYAYRRAYCRESDRYRVAD